MFALRLVTSVCIFATLIYLLFNYSSVELVFHPDRYHGHEIQKGIFFEGWYYKIVLNDYENTLVVIPGVHMNDSNRHSFIMIAYGNISHYFRFPYETISSATDEFHFTIDNKKNIFSYDQLIVDVKPNNDDDATESFQLNLTLSSNLLVPDLFWILPGTMGPYSWIPTMQCYHHVLSMKTTIHGSMQMNQNAKQTISGIGYIEKDWGNSFPSIWIWGQANQWEHLPATSSASIFFSLALIPWYFNLEFAGFLIVFEHNNEFYRFNTYLQSIIHDLMIDPDTHEISFDVYDVLFQYKLHVSSYSNGLNNIDGALLYGPRSDRMIKYVKELLTKNIHFDVRLSKLVQNMTSNNDDNNLFIKHGYYEEIIFQGRAQSVALEITGNVKWLSEKFRQAYENIYPWNFSLIRSIVMHYKLILTSILTMIIMSFIFAKCR
ncbi:unnamed protein product [Rotaria socialis]|uniref:Uncharacterized protein n=1 Tax=Rotaria socialis TaxID=392032 RepID=A0A817V5C4_9BILA|nr:unnamed protein product [Rotaria socialis]CAF3338631.1 unnamed protein product [Rotaria socialis]